MTNKQLPIDAKELVLIQLRRLEWEAWQDVVKELKELGIDINSQNLLNRLLIRWSQTNHELQQVKA